MNKRPRDQGQQLPPASLEPAQQAGLAGDFGSNALAADALQAEPPPADTPALDAAMATMDDSELDAMEAFASDGGDEQVLEGLDALDQAGVSWAEIEGAMGGADGAGSSGGDGTDGGGPTGAPPAPVRGQIPYREEMEEGYGQSFGDVCALTGEGAEQQLAEMNALAATDGSNVLLSKKADKDTVAHEMAHVAQLRKGGQPVVAAKALSGPGDAAEGEADAAAKAVLAGDRPEIRERPAAAVSRRVDGIDSVGSLPGTLPPKKRSTLGKIAHTTGDVATSMAPIVSNIRDGTTAVTGVDPYTKEKVGVGGRILAGAFALPVVGNALKYVGKGTKLLGRLGGLLLGGLAKLRKGGVKPKVSSSILPRIKGMPSGKAARRKAKPKKGQEFRGGKKKNRDNWFGVKDKKFWKWWEANKKTPAYAGRDIDSTEEALALFAEWKALGSPKR